MTDEELERQLRRFRVPSPDSTFRARVIGGPAPRRVFSDAVIGWCIAAGVSAIACLGAWTTSREQQRWSSAVLAAPSNAGELKAAFDLLGPDGRERARLGILARARDERPARPAVLDGEESLPW